MEYVTLSFPEIPKYHSGSIPSKIFQGGHQIILTCKSPEPEFLCVICLNKQNHITGLIDTHLIKALNSSTNIEANPQPSNKHPTQVVPAPQPPSTTHFRHEITGRRLPRTPTVRPGPAPTASPSSTSTTRLRHNNLPPEDVASPLDYNTQYLHYWSSDPRDIFLMPNTIPSLPKKRKRKVYASQVQLRTLRKGPQTSKLARASPRRSTGPAQTKL
eukprot:1154370-Pelagomonas_calceolata.AAC.1